MLYYSDNKTIVIDPGDAETCLWILDKKKLILSDILLTHHHLDHIGGCRGLKLKTNCRIFGFDTEKISFLDKTIEPGQSLELGEFTIQVLGTPGHTIKSVCYYVLKNGFSQGAVFTGDTLFIGGCGRILEGNAQQMFASLESIAALPDETLVYPGHDYTLENFQFALTVEPDNQEIIRKMKETKTRGGQYAIPSTIGFEKKTNPFLRCHSPTIRKSLNLQSAENWQVFAELRKRKDRF